MAKRVLIVDDSKTVRHQVGVPIKDAGYEVLEAADGQEGLTKLSSEANIALVISDVNMPNMNGLEFLEAIRKLPQHVALPVVMLTTEAQTGLMDRARSAGAKGWIIKPFNPTLLMAAVKKLAGSP